MNQPSVADSVKIACKYGLKKRKVDFQLWSANLVVAFIKVRQAKFFAVPDQNTSVCHF